jgi:hypothetical protein
MEQKNREENKVRKKKGHPACITVAVTGIPSMLLSAYPSYSAATIFLYLSVTDTSRVAHTLKLKLIASLG